MSIRHGNFAAGGSPEILDQFGKSGSAAPQPGTFNTGLALSIDKMPRHSEASSSQSKRKRHENLPADASVAAAAMAPAVLAGVRPMVAPSHGAPGGYHAVPQASTGNARRWLPLALFGSSTVEVTTMTDASAIAAASQGGLRIATALLFCLGLIALMWGLSAIGQEFASATPDTRPAGSICSTLSACRCLSGQFCWISE
jgi:hypothetical protein